VPGTLITTDERVILSITVAGQPIAPLAARERHTR
jgi:hypothetical protein